MKTKSAYKVTPSTKAYFPLNGNSFDFSGNIFTGSDTGIVYPQGKFGRAASFEGTAFILLPSGMTRLSGVMTAGIWVNPSNLGSDAVILSDWSGGGRNFQISYDSASKSILALFGNGSTSQDAFMSSLSIKKGAWIHICVTRNGTEHILFINGVPVSFQTGSYSGGTTSNERYIGADSAGGTFWSGLINDVFLEDRKWSIAEVSLYYRSSFLNYSLNKSFLKLISSIFTQTINTTDSFLYSFARTFTENITNTDTFLGLKIVLKNLTETINNIDTIFRNITRNMLETINNSDVFTRFLVTIRIFSETINNSSVLVTSRVLNQYLIEVTSFVDQLIIKLNGIVTNFWSKVSRGSDNDDDWTKTPFN